MGTEPHPELVKAQNAIARLGLRVLSTFVPWSESRNAKEKYRSFNYRCELVRNGKPILTTDYSMGVAHSPAHKGRKRDGMTDRIEHLEVETGKVCRWSDGSTQPHATKTKIEPDETDIILSLVRDSDVLQYGSFESWASEFGYDTDSRKAEAIYRQCLANSLALKAAIGQDELEALYEYSREI